MGRRPRSSCPTGSPRGSASTPPHYLGPTIVAPKDQPVRIVFYNLLPTGTEGDLFLPTDSTLDGFGHGPDEHGRADSTTAPSWMTIRNPACSDYPKPESCFK